MPDWSIEPKFDVEPFRINDNGTHGCLDAQRGENCRHTDCPECGRQASAQLRAEAMLSTDGVLALAREVVRIQEGYSARAMPEYAVTVGDLARCRRYAEQRLGIAWAEGIVQALVGDTELRPTDYHGRADEHAAFRAGVALAGGHDGRLR